MLTRRIKRTTTILLLATIYSNYAFGLDEFKSDNMLFSFFIFLLLITLCAFSILLFKYFQQQKRFSTLLISEQRLKSTVEGSGDTLWDWNIRTGEIVRINDKFNMDSAPQGKFIPNQHCIHPQDIPMVERILKQHFAERTAFFEASYRIKNNMDEWHWVLDKGKVIEKDTNLNPIRMTGIVRDISHLKTTEERLNLFAKCVESLTDAIAIYDADYRLVDS